LCAKILRWFNEYLRRGIPTMGLEQISHVVILLQENRSFDEYFGTFPGAAGFQDPAGVFTNLYGNGILPFRMSTYTSRGLQRDGNGHDWDTFQSLYRGATSGTPNNWSRQGVQSVIGYYAANDVPFHWDLARTFALCDQYYGSALSATASNRLFLISGCVEDPQLLTNPSYIPGPGLWPGPAISEATGDPPQLGPAAAAFAAANKESLYSSEPGLGALSWQNYADMLFQQDVQWQVYDETSILQPSPIVSPSPLNGWGSMNILQQFQSWSQYQANQPPPGQFEADANGGTLPAISWIIPPFWASEWEDDHPSDGAAYIAGKLAAILNGIDANGNPLWNSTVFILIYDESGGHFDHVVPPVAPAGTPGEFLPGLPGEPFGAGFRTPRLLFRRGPSISPCSMSLSITRPFCNSWNPLRGAGPGHQWGLIWDGLDGRDQWRWPWSSKSFSSGASANRQRALWRGPQERGSAGRHGAI
jgi:phospholipase C